MYIENGLNDAYPFRTDTGYLHTLVFAVTSRCPLNCQHCFEWENLDTRESLTLQELKDILNRFQLRGLSHAQLSGGEPLCRLDDLIELIRTAKQDTEFWILTSGYGLTLDATGSN